MTRLFFITIVNIFNKLSYLDTNLSIPIISNNRIYLLYLNERTCLNLTTNLNYFYLISLFDCVLLFSLSGNSILSCEYETPQ